MPRLKDNWSTPGLQMQAGTAIIALISRMYRMATLRTYSAKDNWGCCAVADRGSGLIPARQAAGQAVTAVMDEASRLLTASSDSFRKCFRSQIRLAIIGLIRMRLT